MVFEVEQVSCHYRQTTTIFLLLRTCRTRVFLWKFYIGDKKCREYKDTLFYKNRKIGFGEISEIFKFLCGLN